MEKTLLATFGKDVSSSVDSGARGTRDQESSTPAETISPSERKDEEIMQLKISCEEIRLQEQQILETYKKENRECTAERDAFKQ